MDYGEIFKKGFLHTWNNKFLYVLGFLAALGGSGSSGGGGGNVNTGNFGGSGGNDDFDNFLEGFGFDPANMEAIIASVITAFVAVLCVIVLFSIVMWFVRMIAEAAMIQSVVDIENGIETNFRKAFSDGRPFMGTIFMTKLIFWGIPFVLIIIGISVMFIPLVTGGLSSTGSNPFDGLAFGAFIPIVCIVCLMFPYSIVVNLIFPLAQRGIVLKGMDAMESVGYGWEMLKSKTADVLILAFLYAVVGFIVGLVSLIFIAPILLATGWPVISAIFFDGSAPGAGAFTLLGVGVLATIIVGAVINAIFIAFRSSSFTLAYLQMDGKSLIKVDPATEM
ncbi:MAG: hypothetical protein AAF902_03325 [Chloroflexota bacterium]